MTDASPPPPPAESIRCPHCGVFIDAARGPDPRVLTCPSCSQSFILPAADGSTLAIADVSRAGGPRPFVIDDSPSDEAVEELKSNDELDGLRIRQISTARRAAYRARSYLLIGCMACAVGAGECIWKAVEHFRRSGFATASQLYVSAAIVLAALGVFMFRRSQRMAREADSTMLQQPDNPPDFSSLHDGSRRWKDLENMR